MKLIIEKNVLLKGLNCVSKALSARNIIPILNGIKFDLTSKGLLLLATNNDITIEYFIDKNDIQEIVEDGCTVIYGKTLLEIIRRLPEENIIIENFESNEVSFKTTNSIYNFNCFMPDDFPSFNLIDAKEPIYIDSKKFKEIINKTTFACSLQESRPLLTGVNIKLNGNIFECIATDSYRLSKNIINLEKMYNENVNIVIPAKNINEFMKLLEVDDNLELHVFSNKILFINGNLKFQSSLLNGNYPNTDNSIPKEFKYDIVVDYKQYYNILDRVSLVTESKEKNIIDFELKNNYIIIRASNIEMGTVEEKMEVDNINNDNIKISFSSKYMLEALKVFEKEKIHILLNGEISPIILKEEENHELIELILPMKTY